VDHVLSRPQRRPASAGAWWGIEQAGDCPGVL